MSAAASVFVVSRLVQVLACAAPVADAPASPPAVADAGAQPLDPTPPVYPASHDAGRVRVIVDVDTDSGGEVEAVRVIRRAPDDAAAAFDEAAANYVRGLQFAPVRRDGRSVAGTTRFEITFEPPEHPQIGPAIVVLPGAGALGDAGTPMPEAEVAAPTEPEPPTATPPSEQTEVRRIRVQTEAPRREAVTGSDFDIEPGKLALVPRGSAEKLMTLAPGVFMVNEGGEGHPSSFFLRGFDAGAGQDIEFKIAGVPLNQPSNAHSHGFTDTLFIIPETVRRLRVTEGPFDARQGDFAVAGTAEFQVGMERRGLIASGSYGRFGAGRTLLMWGPEDFGPGTFVAVDVKGGNGFGSNRSHRAVRAMAGFEVSLPRSFTLSLLGSGYATRFDSAGVIRQDDLDARSVPGCGKGYDAQFFCTYDPNQGGAISQFLASVTVARRRTRDSFEQQLWFVRRGLRIREDFTGYITDIRTDGGEQRGDGLQQSYDAIATGMRGSYALRRDWNFRTQELEFGWGVRYDGASSASERLRRDGGQPYKSVFDTTLRIADVTLYTAATIRPLERLDLNVGVRADTFFFGVRDNAKPTMDREGVRLDHESSEAYGISVGPRLAANVTLLRWPRAEGSAQRLGWGSLQWLSAYGIGSRSSDANALSDGEFAPFARVQSAETGLRAQWSGIADVFGFDARVVGFYTHVDRDLVFDEQAGRNLPVGESNRFGVLGVVRASVDDWLDVQTSATWTEAYLPPSTAGPFQWGAGARLPYVPRLVVRADATLHHAFWIKRQPFDWSVSLGLSHVAPRPLPLDAFGTRYTVVDLGARMRWRYVELGLDIQNLFDARYHQFELFYASNFSSPTARPSMLPQLHFVAGAPLVAMGTLTLYFEYGERKRLRERRAEREALRGRKG